MRRTFVKRPVYSNTAANNSLKSQIFRESTAKAGNNDHKRYPTFDSVYDAVCDEYCGILNKKRYMK